MSPLYEAWYFSRLQLCFASTAVVAANSRVLLERVDARPLLVAGLGTYLVYSLDDLMDRARDEARFPHLRSIRAGRTVWLATTLPLAAVVLMYLARDMRPIRVSQLLFLAIFSVGLSLISVVKPAWRHTTAWLLIRTNAVAAVWAAVGVTMPFVYSADALDRRALLAVLFEWLTMFVIVALWRRGEHDGPSASRQRLPRLLTFSTRDRTATLLVSACMASTAMAVAGVWWHFFPVPSLSVASAPLSTLAVLAAWGRAPVDLRLYNDLLALTSVGCAAFVLATYAVS